MDEYDEPSSSPRPKPSTIPSWVMLGFILGALCVWALERGREPAPSPPVELKPGPAPAAVPSTPKQSDVEAVFAQYRQYAAFVNHVTYVCLYDKETKTFPHCFEVLERGDVLYFRTVPRPPNLRKIDDVPDDAPIELLSPIPDRTQRRERIRAPDRVQAEPPPAEVKPMTSEQKPEVEINPPKP